MPPVSENFFTGDITQEGSSNNSPLSCPLTHTVVSGQFWSMCPPQAAMTVTTLRLCFCGTGRPTTELTLRDAGTLTGPGQRPGTMPRHRHSSLRVLASCSFSTSKMWVSPVSLHHGHHIRRQGKGSNSFQPPHYEGFHFGSRAPFYLARRLCLSQVSDMWQHQKQTHHAGLCWFLQAILMWIYLVLVCLFFVCF